jgi:hypothetical protein
MKPYHAMTKRELGERLRALYSAQPKADWDSLAVGNVILEKGRGWRITHVPPKRGFVLAENVMTGEVEKLLRSQHAGPDLLVTDEGTLAVLRTSHQEEIRKAMAAGNGISVLVQYDYPEIFAPYPESWDGKRREKAQETWARINEMRAFLDSQEPPGWQFRRVDRMIAQAKEEIARQKAYRAECEAGLNIKKPEVIPRLVAGTVDAIRDLKEEIEILRHLRKHLERTLASAGGVRRNRRKGVLKTGRKGSRT